MLATSSSPGTYSKSPLKTIPSFASRAHYDSGGNKSQNNSSTSQTEALRKPQPPFVPRPIRRFSARSLDSFSPQVKARRNMVDASTQYSPPDQPFSPQGHTKTPTSKIAGLQLAEENQVSADGTSENHEEKTDSIAGTVPGLSYKQEPVIPSSHTKRQASDRPDDDQQALHGNDRGRKSPDDSPSKRPRPDTPPVHVMPLQYETCETRDLVVLISSMLMELIRFNDAIPLRDGHLTRFHSRAPPGISVLDYLQRLTTHATLSPPILLSMVYYIDKLCALYPSFTISSLTVHRFLITSATVASKGLSDSFWTNKTYALVGGVSIKELALLELEFLTRVDWKIVPKPEVLVDYYKSLVKRNSEYRLEEQ